MHDIHYIYIHYFFSSVLKHILKCKNVNYSPALRSTDEKMKTKGTEGKEGSTYCWLSYYMDAIFLMWKGETLSVYMWS